MVFGARRLGVQLTPLENQIQDEIDEAIYQLEEEYNIFIKIDYWRFKNEQKLYLYYLKGEI